MALLKVADVSSGRTRTVNVPRELLSTAHGGTRNFGPCPYTPGAKNICTGGAAMTALLGPDLGDQQRRGTPTNSNSLQPLMKTLNDRSPKKWIAGHLLNAELGGSGIQDSNLTPLTVAANGAHKLFEAHIKRMLLVCNQIDRAQPGLAHWYGVEYQVQVANVPYAANLDPQDMHSYCPSHLTLNYEFVTLPKLAPNGTIASTHLSQPVAPGDPCLVQLQGVARPTPAPSANIDQWAVIGGLGVSFSVEIHNEP